MRVNLKTSTVFENEEELDAPPTLWMDSEENRKKESLKRFYHANAPWHEIDEFDRIFGMEKEAGKLGLQLSADSDEICKALNAKCKKKS
jgi:hypothetical protein